MAFPPGYSFLISPLPFYRRKEGLKDHFLQMRGRKTPKSDLPMYHSERLTPTQVSQICNQFILGVSDGEDNQEKQDDPNEEKKEPFSKKILERLRSLLGGKICRQKMSAMLKNPNLFDFDQITEKDFLDMVHFFEIRA